jgi:hypothetical protein
MTTNLKFSRQPSMASSWILRHPPANFPTWDYVDGYTVVVKNSTFGPSGFGGVTLGEVHNSPPKIGRWWKHPDHLRVRREEHRQRHGQIGNTVSDGTGGRHGPYPWSIPPVGVNSGIYHLQARQQWMGWDDCRGLLTTNFPTLYPAGLTVGGSNTLKFTSAAAVKTFLPSSGTPKALTSSAVDPATSIAGELAGNTIALKLNVDFLERRDLETGSGNLKLKSASRRPDCGDRSLSPPNAVLGGGCSTRRNQHRRRSTNRCQDHQRELRQRYDGQGQT